MTILYLGLVDDYNPHCGSLLQVLDEHLDVQIYPLQSLLTLYKWNFKAAITPGGRGHGAHLHFG